MKIPRKLLLALFASGCVAAHAGGHHEEGERLFDAQCAGCHGAEGQSMGPPAAQLSELDGEALTKGLDGHPPVGVVSELTAEERAALEAYLRAGD